MYWVAHSDTFALPLCITYAHALHLMHNFFSSKVKYYISSLDDYRQSGRLFTPTEMAIFVSNELTNMYERCLRKKPYSKKKIKLSGCDYYGSDCLNKEGKRQGGIKSNTVPFKGTVLGLIPFI